MHTTPGKVFKGEIEAYLDKEGRIFEAKIDEGLKRLGFRTQMNKAKIIKKDGYHASEILFVLVLLPLLKIRTVRSFCRKHLEQYTSSRKDTFYRFKTRGYRWRSFLYYIMKEIWKVLKIEETPREERCFIIDDSILPKRGRDIENVSFVYDHTVGRSVLGYTVVALGLFTGKGMYALDFSYKYGKKRHPKSTEERMGDARSISGQMSREASMYTKLELALMMLRRAVSHGITAGYVLFDSWYSWPGFISAIREISKDLHVICRLKDTKVRYGYNGKQYRLSELYQKVKPLFRKDTRTGLRIARATVTLPESGQEATIIFSRDYCEPQDSDIKGVRKDKDPKWVAFLSTDTHLHASTIIRKYTKRWAIEVCFKESKQLLELGKDQSNSFNAQVCATTLSFLRYNLLGFLNEIEKYPTMGGLFEHLAEQSGMVTYAHRLWEFFKGLFNHSLKCIFALLKIEDDLSPFIDSIDQALCSHLKIKGCET